MATFQELKNSETPLLVDFTAEWCGPCKTMKPILEQVKKTLGDNINIIKIDIDKTRKTAEAFQIKSVPTFILFKNNKIVWRQSGVLHAKQLLQIISQKTN